MASLLPLDPRAVPLLLLLALPIGTGWRPGAGRPRLAPAAAPAPRVMPRTGSPRLLACAAAAGLVAGSAHAGAVDRCPPATPGPVSLTGRLLAPTGQGAVPFVPEASPGCPPERVWSTDRLEPGVRIRLEGLRKEGYGRGIVLVRAASILPPDPSLSARLRWGPTRWREALAERVAGLYGPRAPLVSALLLARREGLDPELRQGFARAGIAHLLAISGFHVGVVAGLLYALFRALAVDRRRAAGVAAAATWGYVALLGFPDAASRAAVILTLVCAARVRGRPAARWSPLGAALLVLVALQPQRVASVGFQLSFLGAAGLVGARAPLEARMAAVAGGRLPRWLVDGIAAGAAATAATLPAVAWHFEEVSVVGIPVTLAASPLVSLALPGALASLLLEPVAPWAAAFVAGGVDVLLLALTHGTEAVAALSWAAVWIPREWTALAGLGAAGAWGVARYRRGTARSRRVAALSWGSALVLGWPLLLVAAGRGTLEIRFLDVGQGDAIAIRTPRGRWLLVDAGPPWIGRGPGPVVGSLRRLGVRRLEALFFTHPDADHVGGGVAVLRALEVGVILDPAVATGKGGYVSLIEEAILRGVPWRGARAPLEWELDGVTLRVLHPPPSPGAAESNDLSVVLLLRWGEFEALLTGDAPREVERAVLSELPPGRLEVLKVGHHGSDTSTDSLLLARADPGLAVISAGRGNRYGHPAPAVLERLDAAGVPVRRTDLEGTVRVQARPDGRFRVSGGGPGGP